MIRLAVSRMAVIRQRSGCDNGFGFIVRDSGGKDVFVHISALAPSGVTALNERDRVIVDIARGRKRAGSRTGTVGLGRASLIRGEKPPLVSKRVAARAAFGWPKRFQVGEQPGTGIT
jgi:cold shock CspA family protein